MSGWIQAAGSVIGGGLQAYGGVKSAKMMADQQSKMNQLARDQFNYAKELAGKADIAKENTQNEMEMGLANSLYGNKKPAAPIPGQTTVQTGLAGAAGIPQAQNTQQNPFAIPQVG